MERRAAGNLAVMDIDTIEREELKAKLDRGDDFKLVMALNDFAFRAMRIPGSIRGRYDGGLSDWADAGYPFEGEQAG